MTLILYNIVAIWLACSLALTYLITQHQGEAYMDEVFHIPQARNYCNGSFEKWDPKITTLPGLYLFSIGFFKLVSLVSGFSMLDLCSVLGLRCINVIFSCGNIFLLHGIISTLSRKRKDDKYVLLKAVSLSLMPLLYFFNSLYYTDPGSVFFVLYAYQMYLWKSYSTSAILGIVSMIFRQTNIVWIFFMAICNIAKIISRRAQSTDKKLDTLWQIVINISWISVIGEVISCCWSYMIAGLTAVLFVLWNGSIVVGDKSHHEACFHAAQLGYFGCFCLIMGLPHFISFNKVKEFIQKLCQYKLATLFITGFALYLAHKFTFAHPYLVADNRHYTFYVWLRIFRRHDLVKYALVPIYMYSLWAINSSIRHVHILIRISYWFCVCVATVPQKLMEFRYFVIPYIVTRLHMRNESMKSLLCELTVYLVIDFFVLYRFLYKPIFWPHIHEPQRLMW